MYETWLNLLQLDDRYFQGLTGQYDFQLQYRLHKDGEADYIARSKPLYFMNRSATTELDLEAGRYLVLVKISASRDQSRSTPEQIVRKACQTRPDKLMAVGLSYDLAHAKGHLKESGLEHEERLRRERRDKRKTNAKKVFEAQKVIDKKKKLRRLRLEAKEKAKQVGQRKGSLDNDDAIEISIKMGESTLYQTKSLAPDDSVGGSKVFSLDGTSKQLKITVETSDKADNTKDGDNATSEKIKQPAEAEQAKQALERNQQGDEQGTGAKSVGKQDSDTVGNMPATSAESISTTEDNDKAEGQPSTKLDESATTGGEIANDRAPTETGGTADKSNAVEPSVQVQPLTLDDVSDDGLSWSSDIDAPSDSPSDTASDTDSDSDTTEPPPTDPPPPADQQPAVVVDPAKDPWNAVCVFGLRVYAQGSQAEIEVVKGRDDDGSKKLDVDDRAADATKKLQKGGAGDEGRLGSVGAAPAWEEESRQG